MLSADEMSIDDWKALSGMVIYGAIDHARAESRIGGTRFTGISNSAQILKMRTHLKELDEDYRWFHDRFALWASVLEISQDEVDSIQRVFLAEYAKARKALVRGLALRGYEVKS